MSPGPNLERMMRGLAKSCADRQRHIASLRELKAYLIAEGPRSPESLTEVDDRIARWEASPDRTEDEVYAILVAHYGHLSDEEIAGKSIGYSPTWEMPPAVTDPSHRETPETRLTPAEKQALLEREQARMAEPGYRESLVPPPAELTSHRETPEAPPMIYVDFQNRHPQGRFYVARLSRFETVPKLGDIFLATDEDEFVGVPCEVILIDHDGGVLYHRPCDPSSVPGTSIGADPVRSLPPWMPTPEELAAWEDEWWNMSGTKRLGPGARLLRAVRWLLEEREK